MRMTAVLGFSALLAGCVTCREHPYACATAVALVAGSIALQADQHQDGTQAAPGRLPVNMNNPPRVGP